MKTELTDSADRTLITDMDFKKTSVKIGYGILIIIMILLACMVLYPIVWLTLGSFKSLKELYTFPPTFIPKEWKWGNYANAWTSFKFALYIKNTLVILMGNLLFSIIPAALSGYALAKLNPRGKKIIFYLILASVMIPGQVYMIPLYLNLKDLPIFHLNLFDSYWGLWLPHIGNAFYVYLFYSFFLSVPTELLEAARIDGAKEVGIFVKVVVPICKPVFVVTAIFTVTSTWNEFFWPMLLLTDMNKFPIMTAIYAMLRISNASGGANEYNSMFAGLVIGLLPALALFAIFQKQIMRGYTMSGIKG
ncbi:sugar ABC transporter ATP-binding protein [Paenibacillus marchantiophytorum]|uniref:Sugar ABC transporter ATP-binding protein n=1 Tax=Paenibacillus marchantiophytorum TaxID=1619310 RepID=A0ABQ1EY38_9BACL|nr:carbohydrate ABC transporter permease [Paenibacillus marchantiophytorum]GFZ91853.1 sugar ABC transporter ATP-binding protein [Paenibacillus marchantiophytorum]